MKIHLITHPATHRARWLAKNLAAVVDQRLLSAEDLSRWACDVCMAPLDPSNPIYVIGGVDGMSVCAKHVPPHSAKDVVSCPCCSLDWDEQIERDAKSGKLLAVYQRLMAEL